MDDYNLSSLEESKNEWCSRLVSILTGSIITGIMSIYKEALRMCDDNDQQDKYLMTFQNLLTRVPEWNPNIVETERKRIEHETRCKYLEDLVTCVHIIQLKALTCIRVGQKQKKIDLDIPSIDKFIHKVYINTARKLYTNSYLFEKNIPPLEIQKNNYQLERLVKESILMTIRDNIPIEEILRVYMDETDEQNIEVTQQEVITKKSKEEKHEQDTKTLETEDKHQDNINENSIKHEVQKEIDQKDDKIDDTLKTFIEKESNNINFEINHDKEDKSLENNFEITTENNNTNKLNFSDIDTTISDKGEVENIEAPKTIERLNQISIENAERRKQEDEDDNEKIEFGDDANIEIDDLDISDIEIIR
jgi:hypothetical protein